MHPDRVRSTRDSDNQIEPHPLFPQQDPRISRFLPDGKRESCPKTFSASELRSWQQLVDLYGGGTYELRALTADGCRYTARTEKVFFKGASKPFTPTPAPEPEAPAPPMGGTPAPPWQCVSPPWQYAPPPPPPDPNAELFAMIASMLEQRNNFFQQLVAAKLNQEATHSTAVADKTLDGIIALVVEMREREDKAHEEGFLRGLEFAQWVFEDAERMARFDEVTEDASAAPANPTETHAEKTIPEPPCPAPQGWQWIWANGQWDLTPLPVPPPPAAAPPVAENAPMPAPASTMAPQPVTNTSVPTATPMATPVAQVKPSAPQAPRAAQARAAAAPVPIAETNRRPIKQSSDGRKQRQRCQCVHTRAELEFGAPGTSIRPRHPPAMATDSDRFTPLIA